MKRKKVLEGKKMKLKLKKWFIRLTLMSINLQLVIAPNLAVAQQNDVLGQVVNTTLQIGQMGLSALQQVQFQRQMMQMQSSMGNLRVQPLSPVEVNPLYAQFGCVVLQAKAAQVNDDMKCDPQSYDPSQVAMYAALQSVAEENRNAYDNFTVEGNSNFSQGAGCYENANKQFSTMLKARVAMLDELSNTIDRQTETFQKLAERDLDNIKRGEALITGKDPGGKYLKDIKFEDKFNDPQCASFMAGSSFKSTGSSKGFQGIRDMLFSANNSPKKGMSPQEFKGKFINLRDDIRSIGEQVSKEITRGDFASTNIEKLNLTSKFNMQSMPAISSILKRNNIERNQQIQEWQKEFGRMGAGKRAQQMLSGVFSEGTNLANEIANYERSEKNDCVNKYLNSNFSGPGGFTKRLSDPNISKKANREADSAFKNFVTTVLSDNEYTIEEKIKLIRNEEKRGGNDRYTMVTGKSMTVKGQQLGASARLRASDVVGLFVDNCKAQFESSPNGQGSSQRDIINSISSISNKYNNYKRSFAAKVKGDIVKEMLDCPQDSSTGKAANSCNGALDMRSGTFCLRTANTCASNMQACLSKADTVLETTKAEQKQVAARYKQNMDSFKLRMTQAFAQTDQLMKAKSRELDALMRGGTLFNTPTGLKLDLTTSKLMKGVDPALEIEDPVAYQKMMQENLKKIKTNIVTQNKELEAAAKKESAKYLSNYKQQKSEWEKIARNCKALIDRFAKEQQQQIAEQNKQIGEQNKKVADMCKKAQTLPPGCDGDAAGELAKEILEASSMAGDVTAAGELKKRQSICDGFNNEKSNPFLDNSSTTDKKIPTMSISEFCKKKGSKMPEYQTECETFLTGNTGGKPACSERLIKLEKDKLCFLKSANGQAATVQLRNEVKDTGKCAKQPLESQTEAAYKLLDCTPPSEVSAAKTAAQKKILEGIKFYQQSLAMSQIGEVNIPSCNSMSMGQLGKQMMGGPAGSPLMNPMIMQGLRQ